MNTSDVIAYYQDLLIYQYRQKLRARAHIGVVVQEFVADQLPAQVRDAFNLDTAVGVQLDIIGKSVGVTRTVQTFTATVQLSDTDYRVLIKIKAASNIFDSTLENAQEILFQFFSGNLLVFDTKAMSVSYFLDSTYAGLNLAQAFVKLGLLPRPMGVQLASLIYLPSIDTLFGHLNYEVPNSGISGHNTYEAYDTNRHWLDYSDVLSG